MKIKLLLFIVLAFETFADDYFFYHFRDRIELTPFKSVAVVILKESEVERANVEFSYFVEKINLFKPSSSDNEVFLILSINDSKKDMLFDYLGRKYEKRYGFGFKGRDNVIHYPTGEVIVKFKDDVSLSSVEQLARLFKVQNKGKLSEFQSTYLFRVTDETRDNVFEVSSKFSVTQFVEFAQPNFIRYGMLLDVPTVHNHLQYIPDDSLINFMWHINNTGNNIPEGIQGIPGCDMRMFEAWNVTTGNPNVIIAITDTGIDTNHVDLIPNLTDRRLWYDAVDNDQKPYDEYYHGTGVSGCSSAKGDNQIGTAGIAYN
ncbi:MAG: S8 family serine peptidase, partial [Ignavibacteria bacterium]|nr:S8 family serine peptidase [Ignavibacteria bacterium]